MGYFLAFYAQMLNVNGRFVIPEGTFVTAAALRCATLAVLVYFVVRDILRPELDVLRRTYGGDPDGGDFNDEPGPRRYELLMSRLQDSARARWPSGREHEDHGITVDRARDPQPVDG
jgi:hypothetical protein